MQRKRTASKYYLNLTTHNITHHASRITQHATPTQYTVTITHHITSHHITSHHITSHHITSHHITSPHLTSPHCISISHLISYTLSSQNYHLKHLLAPAQLTMLFSGYACSLSLSLSLYLSLHSSSALLLSSSSLVPPLLPSLLSVRSNTLLPILELFCWLRKS